MKPHALKPLTLQDRQEVSTSILKRIHTFCVENHISYGVTGGTLIGAVRDKRFIPWDDDVDIHMLRPDYERFLSSFHCPGLGLLSQYDPKSFIFYSRVYDLEKTIWKPDFPFRSDYQGGVAVDVFPLDYVEDDYSAFQDRIERIKVLFQLQMQCRETLISYSTMPTLKKKAGLLMRKIIRHGGRDISNIKNEALRISREIPVGSTSHISHLSFPSYPNEKVHWRAEDFAETVLLDFEGFQVCAYNGYDRVLRTFYGDYMTPPPAKEQMPLHDASGYYWR